MLEEYSNSVKILSEGIDKFEAFREIIESCSVIPDRAGFLRLVTEREKIQSTGINHGVAIAHGKRDSVTRVHIVLGISRDGIHYDDIYTEPVRLVFIISSSKKDEKAYVKALGDIITWVHEEELREKIKNLELDDKDVRRFFEMFKKQEFSRYED
ncbi:MAG: PTS sugar transporter subunit IIA [Sphaerochaetaceae bacterium]|nr:PTS sugar transporter subunit IIA [Sphaerochaetaceae bacterium]